MSEKPELFMRTYIGGLGGGGIDLRVVDGGCALQVDVVQDPYGWKLLCKLVEELTAFQAEFPIRRKGSN